MALFKKKDKKEKFKKLIPTEEEEDYNPMDKLVEEEDEEEEEEEEEQPRKPKVKNSKVEHPKVNIIYLTKDEMMREMFVRIQNIEQLLFKELSEK